MDTLRRRRLPPLSPTSPRLRRLALGIALHELGTATGIPPGRLSILERFPLEITNTEADLISQALAGFEAQRHADAGAQP